MPDTKITALAAITTVAPSNDLFPIVDVSDNSMAASGTTKNITVNQLLGAGGIAALSSATITGDLTVSTAARFNGGALAGYLNGSLMFGSSGNIVNFFAQSNGFAFKENTGANNLLTISNAGVFGFLDGAGGTRMTLNSSGNLGLGIAPSAWTSAFGSVLQFKSAGSSAGGSFSGSSADNFRMFSNTYYDGNYKYIANGFALQYEQAAGKHQWYTSGTVAGSTNGIITFTQAMTLDASGRLVIGNTTARSTADVYGTLTVGSNTAPNFDFKRDVAISGADSGIGSLNYGARYDGSNYGVGALITGQSGGAWTSTSTPGYLSFRTTPSSATTPVERVRITAVGDVLTLLQTSAPSLATNSQMVFTLTSDTNLRISVRGSDGTTRTANITLA